MSFLQKHPTTVSMTPTPGSPEAPWILVNVKPFVGQKTEFNSSSKNRGKDRVAGDLSLLLAAAASPHKSLARTLRHLWNGVPSELQYSVEKRICLKREVL
jgi:hypothetical protein